MNAYPPPQQSPAASSKLSGLALASFILCIAIVLLRGASLATYVHVVGTIPAAKIDVANVAIGALVLGFYVWSAIGIYQGDLRGYRRLMRLSLVFGVITLGTVVYNYSTVPMLPLIQAAYPLLWALIVPVPIGLAVFHLATAFVAYRASSTLTPPENMVFR